VFSQTHEQTSPDFFQFAELTITVFATVFAGSALPFATLL
jgi:hypothetical protein